MKTSKELRYQNLLRLIAEAGSAAELARRTERLRDSYISQIVTRVKTRKGTIRGVGDIVARQCERAMHKPVGWMDQDHSREADEHAIREPTSTYPQATERRTVPVLSWVQAGLPTAIANAAADPECERVAVQGKYGPGAYALIVRGDSMFDPARPGDTFPEGCRIVIDPDARAENGSLVVARFEGSDQATFKRLILDGPQQFLAPLNPRYPVLEINSDAILVGVVREVVSHRTLA